MKSQDQDVIKHLASPKRVKHPSSDLAVLQEKKITLKRARISYLVFPDQENTNLKLSLAINQDVLSIQCQEGELIIDQRLEKMLRMLESITLIIPLTPLNLIIQSLALVKERGMVS
jgi:hypothetical protein